jgi:hypothetical protein
MCAAEIKFIQMLIEEIVPGAVTRPATLLEDNTGCIFLMENQAVGNRTKHIDIKMHHIREMMQGDDPRMIVKFTRSEMNFADPMTKNVVEAIYQFLVPALKDGRIADVIYETIDREDVKEADRVKARRGKVGSGKQDSDVSFARDRPRDQFYVSEIFVEKPNVELLDEENSYPIGIMNG